MQIQEFDQDWLLCRIVQDRIGQSVDETDRLYYSQFASRLFILGHKVIVILWS